MRWENYKIIAGMTRRVPLSCGCLKATATRHTHTHTGADVIRENKTTQRNPTNKQKSNQHNRPTLHSNDELKTTMKLFIDKDGEGGASGGTLTANPRGGQHTGGNAPSSNERNVGRDDVRNEHEAGSRLQSIRGDGDKHRPPPTLVSPIGTVPGSPTPFLDSQTHLRHLHCFFFTLCSLTFLPGYGKRHNRNQGGQEHNLRRRGQGQGGWGAG